MKAKKKAQPFTGEVQPADPQARSLAGGDPRSPAMQASRRAFGRACLAALLCLPGAAGWLMRRLAPRRVARARPAREFPGRIRPMDPRTIARPGRWLG